MKKGKYMPRLLDSKIEMYLETFGAIFIRGPKWCGKTTTAERFAKSEIKIQDPIKNKDYLLAAQTNISLILEGENPRLIDEWQDIIDIWNAVRNDVDNKRKSGLYILTGSRIPTSKANQHSGAGRIGTLFMYPMSLFESKDSNGSISLERIFSKSEKINGKKASLSVNDIAYCLCRGGWPDNLGKEYSKCALKLNGYLDLIYESDDLNLKKYAKNSAVAKNIVKSYARNISSIADNRTIFLDAKKEDKALTEARFYEYITALKNVFLIDEVPAWNPAIRSKTAIRSTPKKELIDPSIAALYLGVIPNNFVNDFQTFGLLFESMCIRDLKIYADSLNGKVYYYQDRYGLEADAVIVLDDGRYGLVEIKLGSKEIQEAAKNLCKLEKLIQDANYHLPEFKMIITGGELAFTLEDNVLVVPIGCLKN